MEPSKSQTWLYVPLSWPTSFGGLCFLCGKCWSCDPGSKGWKLPSTWYLGPHPSPFSPAWANSGPSDVRLPTTCCENFLWSLVSGFFPSLYIFTPLVQPNWEVTVFSSFPQQLFSHERNIHSVSCVNFLCLSCGAWQNLISFIVMCIQVAQVCVYVSVCVSIVGLWRAGSVSASFWLSCEYPAQSSHLQACRVQLLGTTLCRMSNTFSIKATPLCFVLKLFYQVTCWIDVVVS